MRLARIAQFDKTWLALGYVILVHVTAPGVAGTDPTLLISEVFDGPYDVPGFFVGPKVVEFTNCGSGPLDLSEFSIGVFPGGSTSLQGGASQALVPNSLAVASALEDVTAPELEEFSLSATAVDVGDAFWEVELLLGDQIDRTANIAGWDAQQLTAAGFPGTLDVMCCGLSQPRLSWLDAVTLVWDPIAAATEYEVYRLMLTDLVDTNRPLSLTAAATLASRQLESEVTEVHEW